MNRQQAATFWSILFVENHFFGANIITDSLDTPTEDDLQAFDFS